VKHRTHQAQLLSIALSSLIFTVSGAMAQTKVTPVPSNLTVLGTRCVLSQFGCEKMTRNLLLRGDRGMTNLQIYSLDLNRSDGAAVFPATAIRPAISQNSLQPNQPLTIPIQFDLATISSGEYNGAILLSYTEGELTIPVTIRVKDYPLAPLILLVLGVILGIGISSYRTEGMARDEILVRVGRLRVQMQADPQLDGSFDRQIANYLIDVDTALESKRWEMAQQAFDRAIGIWDKWRKDRQEWVVQIQYRQELAKRLQEEMAVTVDSFYLQSMRRQLEDWTRKTVDLASPLQLRDILDDLQQQFNRYLQGRSKLERLKQLTAELPLEPQTAWLPKIQQFQLGLDSLSPPKNDLFTTWQKSIDGAIFELIQTLEKQKTTEIFQNPISTLNRAIVYPILAPVPAVRPPTDPIEIARRRLLWFNWLSYALAVGLLAGSGFVQLYVTKPTFGANGFGDYFILMAWGFGAEVTRDSVTKVLRDWKLPGVK
jgi:hypothetical protein